MALPPPKHLRMEALYQVLGTMEFSAELRYATISVEQPHFCQRNTLPVRCPPYTPRAYSSRSLYFSTRWVGVLGSASRKRTLCGILKRARRAAHHACNSSAVVWASGRRTTSA